MNYWIFIVTGHKIGKEVYSAREIYSQRMKDSFWGNGEKTPNKKNLSKGDKVIYYIGLIDKVFGGTATLNSSVFTLDESQKHKFGHGKQFYTTEYGVILDEIDIWSNPHSVEDLVPYLTFIENKEFWYTYFQGGVRQITEADYLTITGQRELSLEERIVETKDVESQTEFALETHLEEFLHQNWGSIDWGVKLELYQTEDQNGRQFPAGTWSIDFLARDVTNNDLVVIELKRGKTSDSTVGQILRYINWVKDNVAEADQNVRGIIIAKEADEALKYSVKALDIVVVKTYVVDFKLRSFTK